MTIPDGTAAVSPMRRVIVGRLTRVCACATWRYERYRQIDVFRKYNKDRKKIFARSAPVVVLAAEFFLNNSDIISDVLRTTSTCIRVRKRDAD
jgi:hypothetical protein